MPRAKQPGFTIRLRVILSWERRSERKWERNHTESGTASESESNKKANTVEISLRTVDRFLREVWSTVPFNPLGNCVIESIPIPMATPTPRSK